MDSGEVVTQEQLSSFAPPDPSINFAEQSHLTYVIPSATAIDLEDAFKDIETGTSVFDHIEQRESLFFDETVDVLLILKTPLLAEPTLRSLISRLSLSLEAQVVNSSGSSRDDSPGSNDPIFSGSPQNLDDPFIIGRTDPDEDDDGEVGKKPLYCIWRVPVFLSRPRIRLHCPSIVFTASAYLKPDVSAELNSGRGGYLQSGMPSGYNLLESFANDPSLNGVRPRLSALRVSKVAPVTRQQELLQHIRALQQLTLNIYPVIHTRIRFSRPNTAPASSTIVAMLEVDFTQHFDCEVSLDKIELAVPDSNIVSLNDDAGLRLPLNCVSHDHITFLYHITPQKMDITPRNSIRDLSISINATALVEPGVCMAPLTMSWTTTLDFTTPVNPGFGPPSAGTGIQRAHRPSQLSISGQTVQPLKSPSVIRPDALPTLEAATTRAETSTQDLGITMSFTGPSEPVHPGDIFSWTVYVVNRASEKTSLPPRKLALVAVPKRRRHEVRPVRPPSTSTRRKGESEIADAVQDENILHALQKNAVVDSTDVVCLSADTRVGPLAPGACHVVELQFLALQEGLVGIEAIRVVDLGSQEHVDIRDLPTTMISPVGA
ncbi:hypothetical protein NLU13_2208 [Sarocladium strictum]|uniref:Trafficking protein particle complex II-specific subunit 65 IgD3 domain-containing protein n=1 Tax=Sarocladium strictum TaxID=5046 RepID=A0AA39GTY0_SARSR|nr:hypothetical protein NLU13_2208 [Sarocladium strictum]